MSNRKPKDLQVAWEGLVCDATAAPFGKFTPRCQRRAGHRGKHWSRFKKKRGEHVTYTWETP